MVVYTHLPDVLPCLHLRGKQCGASAYIHASRTPPERRGRAGREGGGNETADLEDVLFAGKGSVIEVLCEYVHIPCSGIDPPFLPGDTVDSAGLYLVFLSIPTFYLSWSSEYLILVRI